MPRITLDSDKDHLVTPQHSDARGPVVHGKAIEVSFHPSNVLHGALAVEDTVAISFKKIVASGYPVTKTL